ncbi:MerR family transcriptional regulator [Brevibacillus ginsengisoli]|uniref:MerR family transcriptional regulator n=1 Tax=Brevibacillus ginsengisoli TaxID=363854 RepID=UPI003CE902C9
MLIQEMAKRLQITPRSIRFYEEKGLIAPVKEKNSGYRHFSEDDAWRLQTIIALREVGMPIEQIQQMLPQLDETAHSVLPYLELQRAFMYDRWVELKNAIQTTETMIEQLKSQNSLDANSLYELAESSKQMRNTRKEWSDRWNFNQFASQYDDWVFGNQNGPHAGYEQVLDRVVTRVNPQSCETGLDAGTGTGNLAKRFAGHCRKLSAFDQSTEMLALCKRKNPEVETKLGNFLAIPYLDHTFDFVVTSYAMHHLTDQQKALALHEFDRVLKPVGRLVIADLMFMDHEERQKHLHHLVNEGKLERVQEIEEEYYADRSFLIDQLDKMGYQIEVEQLNPYIHLIQAHKRTS